MKSKLCIGIFLLCTLFPCLAFSQEQNSIPLQALDKHILDDGSYLESEAGISAYGMVNYADLDLAEAAFKYVEKKTSQYIIGVVSLDGYDETHDVHVYVDTSRWIIAYYLATEKPSKIIDWVDYYSSGAIRGSKLELALAKVVAAMSAYLPEATYYDFRYPNATHMIIVADEGIVDNATETFRIKIPSNDFLYSRSYSHASYRALTSNFMIDGVELHVGGNGSGWSFAEGDIPPELLSYNLFHEASLYTDIVGVAPGMGLGAIVLLYTEF